jgi:hypothetical protein
MTPRTIHLNKVLKFFALREQRLTSELRKELRAERDRIAKIKEGGGDFHGAFWRDAKWHVRELLDLRKQTEFRVERSKQRRRLYPLLAAGFLEWLDGVRRNTNEKVGWNESNVHNHYLFAELELTLKVDNLLSLKIGNHFRLVYPCFTEDPELGEQFARVALWAMSEALPDHPIGEMEVLDVLRGRGWKGSELRLRGNEEELFVRRYAEIAREWDELRPQYNL